MLNIKNINRVVLIPFMSVLLLIVVYLSANVLLPLRSGIYGNNHADEGQQQAGEHDSGGYVDMNVDFSKMCIVVDSGHGGADPGKVGEGDILEKDINLAIALKLKDKLESAQIKVILTRDSDQDLSGEADKNKKVADLTRRCDIINNSGADMVISIHQNSYVTPKAVGAQMFYYKKSEQGKVIAQGMQQILAEKLGTTRQIKSDVNYYILLHSNLPTVIAECGFLSNAQEAQMLCTDEYQEKVADALYCGIIEYLITKME